MSTGQSVLGHNMYAYCGNNPVNMSDDAGCWPSWATKILIGIAVIAVCAVVTVATGGAAAGPIVAAINCVATGALQGAVASAAIGTVVGGVSEAANHRLKTGSWDGVEKAIVDGAATGLMTGAISGAVMGGMFSKLCFIEGTLVLASWGQTTIEDIKVGDMVWSENPETGEKALKEVLRTFVNETDELVHVFADGEEIVTTPEHPFYLPTKGWTGAIHLRAGDILVLLNGEYVTVEKVQHEILEAPVKVYNFEVDDFHTYYVGDAGVLVHNVCGTQRHHMLTNKNRKYTPMFNEITNKYGLNPNKNWNIRLVTKHIGRHSTSYHEFMLRILMSIDTVAAGNTAEFIKYFNKLANYVVAYPEILY